LYKTMADIFPLDLGENCKPITRPHEVRRFSSQYGIKPKRCNYSYSKSLSFGSYENSQSHSYSLSPKTSHSFSAAILFKDSRGVPVIQPLKSPSSRSSSIDDDILNFFKCYKCYDLIPTSAKLVILDTGLSLKKAFYAMLETGVRSCPVWSSASQTYVGLVTLTDFISVIQKNYKGSLEDLEELEDQTLQDWLGDNKTAKEAETVAPDTSLYQAISLMVAAKKNKISIMDPNNGNILYVLTQKPLLRFLLHFVPNLQYFDHLNLSLTEAGVGTFENLQVATPSQKVRETMNQFEVKGVSCVPVVDSGGKCVDVYCKYDLIQLVSSSAYNHLELTIREALTARPQSMPGVLTCKGEDSVLTVIEKLVGSEVSQLVVVDEGQRAVGVVTTTDLLHYLVSVHRQSSHEGAVRRGSLAAARLRQRREDSIGEEVEQEEESSPENFNSSCSPPRWFNV